jgi:hypothetical protein
MSNTITPSVFYRTINVEELKMCSVGDFVKPLSQPVSNRSCAGLSAANVTTKVPVASVHRKLMMRRIFTPFERRNT